ncbi:MAG: hypothetical protein AB1714_28685 [Acidobacteriota bacterium]
MKAKKQHGIAACLAMLGCVCSWLLLGSGTSNAAEGFVKFGTAIPYFYPGVFVGGGADTTIAKLLRVGGEAQGFISVDEGVYFDLGLYANVKVIAPAKSGIAPYVGAGLGGIICLDGEGSSLPVMHITGGALFGKGKRKCQVELELMRCLQSGCGNGYLLSAGFRF